MESSTALKQLGFVRLKSDVGIYVKGEGEEAVHIALYVDDLFMVGMKLVNINVVKQGVILHSIGRLYCDYSVPKSVFVLNQRLCL